MRQNSPQIWHDNNLNSSVEQFHTVCWETLQTMTKFKSNGSKLLQKLLLIMTIQSRFILQMSLNNPAKRASNNNTRERHQLFTKVEPNPPQTTKFASQVLARSPKVTKKVLKTSNLFYLDNEQSNFTNLSQDHRQPKFSVRGKISNDIFKIL